jgi:glycosyltransferase involved in cell wall biosynthesis
MLRFKENKKLTIIIPVFNEEECLDQLQVEMDRFLLKIGIETRILFINDGSSDNSFKILQAICSTDPSYELISLESNRGLSTAIKVGIDRCHTSLVGYMDADLQTRPDDFLKMLPYMDEFDMVSGIRKKREDKFLKKLASQIANNCRSLMIGDNIQDTCCPLKIIKTSYAKNIPFFNGMHRFMSTLVQFQGGKVKQIPVQHFPRYAGTAKYHLRNRLIGPFLDTLAVLWMKHRYIHYCVLPNP